MIDQQVCLLISFCYRQRTQNQINSCILIQILISVFCVSMLGLSSFVSVARCNTEKKIHFFPQVHYIPELESMESEEKAKIEDEILRSQFYIYHQLLEKLKVNPDLAVFNESFYFTKLELYKILSREENKIRKKYRLPPVRHHEVNIDPDRVEAELSKQFSNRFFYKVDWQANDILRHGLVHVDIPRAYQSMLSSALPQSLEALEAWQKEILIKYGAADLLLLQGFLKHAKATSETGQGSGYGFLKEIDQYKAKGMGKRAFSRKKILNSCPELKLCEPEFAEELHDFLLAHPHKQVCFFEPIRLWAAGLSQTQQDCLYCESKNHSCLSLENSMLEVLYAYHVIITREKEVVKLIKEFLSRQEAELYNEEIALVFGADHDFAYYFQTDQDIEFATIADVL